MTARLLLLSSSPLPAARSSMLHHLLYIPPSDPFALKLINPWEQTQPVFDSIYAFAMDLRIDIPPTRSFQVAEMSGLYSGIYVDESWREQ